MNDIYRKYGGKDITVEEFNTLVIGHFIKNIPNKLPSPVSIRKGEKMSHKQIESFVSNRNKFDVSIGLKPMQVNFLKEQPKNSRDDTVRRKHKNEIEEVDPLDEYFNLL